MKKIKYILCACLMMASMGMEAKSMKDLLVSMPDSVVPYLNHNLRLEFAELQEMGVKAEVKNLLGETSVMDTLTADFVQLRTSKSAILQMKKLPSANGDSLLCVVKTFAGVEKESELYLFNKIVVNGDITVGYEYVGEYDTNICYELTDIYNNSITTEMIELEIN